MPDSDAPNVESDASAPADAAASEGDDPAGPQPDGPETAEATAPADGDDAVDVDELNFEDDDLGEKLRHASDDQLNSTTFGIIQVDDEGVVQFFNQYESKLSGVDPEEAEGRNFFTQVAPCTNNRLFRGRFKKGVRRGELDETFSYTYTYKMRPTLVDVHLYRDEAGNNWITVQKY
jgi:photoactive yellow protein